MELGRDYDAITAASRAVQLSPSSTAAHLTLARAQLNMGEPSLSLSSYQRVLQLAPGHREAVDESSSVRMLAVLHGRGQGGHRAVVQQPLLQVAASEDVEGGGRKKEEEKKEEGKEEEEELTGVAQNMEA